MRDLVLAYGDEIGLIDQDVGGLEQGVAKESVGAQVLAGDVLLLLLVSGYALQPAQGRDHREEEEQFGMLLDTALHEHRALLRIEARAEEIQDDFAGVLFYLRGAA